ncbi:ATP-binding protein [Sphingomonas sp.]|uniref:ATP-binding protein n=1 Tax=Sphingomonas sp. TaxID=28214 RepID=UPI00286D4D51|nr:ATP-binding protein [Sphingomonas sp.]
MTSASLSANALIEALDEPALIFGGGRTIAANKAARALLGESILDRDIRIAIRHPQALRAVLAGRSVDLAVVGLGGAQRPWNLSVRPIANGHCMLRLTDRSSAIAAERMRVDFVANASHELRTPLATISGFAETLAEDGPLEDGARTRFGATIHNEAARMLRIIEDLMGLSRIEADRFVAPRDRIDLAAIAQTAAQHAAALAERRGCSIDLVADGSFPVIGDHAQLLQVADNLIANAVRYGCSPKAPQVRVEVTSDGPRAVLRVTDYGDGIAAAHLPRLTERFYRVDRARSRDSGGTGLGLAIVKHIVERHRGTLDIRSTVGTGTIVEVRLPLTK